MTTLSVYGPRCLSISQKLASISFALLRSSAISSLLGSRDSIKSLTPIRVAPYDTYRVLARCSTASSLASNAFISCTGPYVIPTDSTYFGGGGTVAGDGSGDDDTNGGSNVEGDLDDDGISDGSSR
ncbi:hypothetical protein Tco_1345639 [Tanacetum coccineum]